MKVGKWSTTAGNNNATPPDGWPEGQAPSTVNDCAREMMASIKTALQDIDFFDHDFTPTYVNANSFTVTGDQTARLVAGRRLKLYDASTIVRDISAASFTVVTTIQLASGSAITASLSSFGVGIINPQSSPIPPVFDTLSVSALAVAGALNVGGQMVVSGLIGAGSAVSIVGTLTAGGASTLKSTLTVEGATVLSGAATLNTTLSVSGTAVMALINALSISLSATARAAVGAFGSVSISATDRAQVAAFGTLSVSGTTVLSGNLLVSATAAAINTFKAWVAVSVTGVVTLRQSVNVASVTDNGVGSYIVNLTNALSGTGYAVTCLIEVAAGSGALSFNHQQGTQVKTASNYEVNTFVPSTGVASDASVVHVGFMGT